jgi:VWFA-related protein
MPVARQAFSSRWNDAGSTRSSVIANNSLLLCADLLLLAQQVPTFHTEVSQVHVDAEVLSADGHAVTGLSAGDFRVFDEGRSQPIVGLGTSEEPLDLVLLVDVSGSTRLAPRKLRSASHQAFGELKIDDRIEVMTFNKTSPLALPFTGNLGAVEDALEEIATGLFGGGTYIHRAIDDAAKNLLGERRTGHRRAILIITDNVGRRTMSEQRVVRDLWEADAVLMGLVFHTWF